jgi:hypothetical protein
MGSAQENLFCQKGLQNTGGSGKMSNGVSREQNPGWHYILCSNRLQPG